MAVRGSASVTLVVSSCNMPDCPNLAADSAVPKFPLIARNCTAIAAIATTKDPSEETMLITIYKERWSDGVFSAGENPN